MFLPSTIGSNPKREKAWRRYIKAKKRYIKSIANDLSYPFYVKFGSDFQSDQLIKIHNEAEMLAFTEQLEKSKQSIATFISERDVAKFFFYGWARRTGASRSLED